MPDEISEYLGEIDEEFRGVDLGDARRNARLRLIAGRVSSAPADSFPKLMASIAEREALYRLFNNEDVEWEAILDPHIAATVERAASGGVTRVVHDTTDFVFSGDREGLGAVMQSTKGFFGHFALAVSDGEARVPLGVAGLLPFVRTRQRTKDLNARKLEVRAMPRAEKESSRWERLAVQVSNRFCAHPVIHVMDQEADDYVLLTELQRAGLRFVVRGSSSRLLQPRSGPSIQAVLDARPSETFRTVPLSSRKAASGAKHRKSHPPRREREARLELRWTQLEIERPLHARTDVVSAAFWVVQVFEPDPPKGETAIAWTLLTSERVEDLSSATAVVDHYRARWRIEEYFRALKQGCAVQQRQLESFDAIVRALAMLIPIAWRLLLLRSLGQDDTPLPAHAVFDDEEIQVVRALCKHKRCFVLSPEPTLRELMLAVAAIGGHIKQNGDPGWIVLGRGFDDVVSATIGWRAARALEM